MTSPLLTRIACAQLPAGPDAARNITRACAFIRQAAAGQARFICLPEAVDLLDEDPGKMRAQARPLGEHAAALAFGELARELGVWLLVGSVSTRNAHGQPVNRCLLLNPHGAVVSHYDKIHLFDATPGSTVYAESTLYERGSRAVVASTPWAEIGLSICYDLRFPHLFRALAQAGAKILTVPAAFMKITGEAHWHTLLRARAIENGCYVVAPAQCGNPYGNRWSYGHSLIVDPWGTVLAEADESEGVIYADYDPAAVLEARTAIPSLGQDRPFELAH